MGELKEAETNLAAAEAELSAVKELQAKLKAKFDAAIAEKNKLLESAAKTKKKMD